ncbi:hypothetical protein EDC01DRAFT_627171 [Geopyxis carbonaria]|nr:hypothetical protein EDC01DRAFT_627171 [Geopyxis carbonaria]
MDWEATANRGQSKFYATYNKQNRFGDRQGSNSPKGGKLIKCYECGKMGHIRRDCFVWKSKNKTEMSKKNNRKPAFRKTIVETSSASEGEDEVVTDDEPEN